MAVQGVVVSCIFVACSAEGKGLFSTAGELVYYCVLPYEAALNYMHSFILLEIMFLMFCGDSMSGLGLRG